MRLHPVESFNTVLSLSTLQKLSDGMFMVENGTYYKAAEMAGIEAPDLHDVNKLMAHAVSAVTTPSRFRTGSLKDLATQLAEYKGYNMRTLDYLPFPNKCN